MLDNEGNIVAKANRIEKIINIIKDNVTVFTVMIPLIAVVASVIKDYFFFIRSYGYYAYFGIESRLMLPFIDNSFFENFSSIAVALLFWAFSIFTMRMIIIKGNWGWKILTVLIIPFICNSFLINRIVGYSDIASFWACMLVLIIVEWTLFFSLGYCLVIDMYADYRVEKRETKKSGKKIKSKKHKWKDKDYRIFGGIMATMAIVALFYNFYHSSFREGELQKYFGVTEIEGEFYAVIDANYEKVVLQKCSIDLEKNNLIIYKDTYICIDNNKLIEYNQYDKVTLITRNSIED